MNEHDFFQKLHQAAKNADHLTEKKRKLITDTKQMINVMKHNIEIMSSGICAVGLGYPDKDIRELADEAAQNILDLQKSLIRLENKLRNLG